MQLKLKFVYKILNNLIDYPVLLQDINIRINPINSRNTNLFYIKFTRANYRLNSPSNILISVRNSIKKILIFIINPYRDL